MKSSESFYKKNIYIVTPSLISSGGPEALHQLSYYMSKMGVENSIAYKGKRVEDPTPKSYKKYAKTYTFLNQVKDDENNYLIFSEVDTHLIHRFPKSKKAIWWLSVDNFLNAQKEKPLLDRMKLLAYGLYYWNNELLQKAIRKTKKFLFSEEFDYYVGSYYAEDFLKKQHVSDVKILIEPVGLDFINSFERTSLSSKERDKVIWYNPIKDDQVAPALAKKFQEFKFKRIEGMNHPQIVNEFKKSRLYIDFGYFPGPERLPKEAVGLGCCVITSKKGAANFYGDVRIPDRFKISDTQDFDKIYKIITNCLESYEEEIANFQDYRDMVYKLEENFEHAIQNYFLAFNSIKRNDFNHYN